MITVPLRRRRILWSAAVVIVLLLLVNAAVGVLQATDRPVPELFELLDVDAEASVPAWFSSLLLFGAALALAAIAAVSRGRPGVRVGRWTGLAVIFVLLSLDEAIALHERAIEPVRDLIGGGGALYFAWVVPAMVLLVVFAAVYLPFWYRLPEPTRTGFAVAGVVYVGGALGMEMVGAYLLTTFGAGIATGLTVLVEEGAEMVGSLLFLHHALGHLERVSGAAGGSADGASRPR